MEKRVLLVNKFYYPRGGDCIVTLNTEALLRDKEMEVGIYAMQYPENIDYQYSNYFASQISFSGGIGAKVKALKRTMGMGDVKTSFSRLLDDFKPRVVHLHNIHSYLWPTSVGCTWCGHYMTTSCCARPTRAHATTSLANCAIATSRTCCATSA